MTQIPRIVMVASAFLLVLAASGHAGPVAAVITVRVITATEPAQPIAGALITLVGPAEQRACLTNAKGECLFDNLSGGAYTVRAAKAAYVIPAKDGGDSSSGTIVRITADESVNVTVRLAKGAALEGIIRSMDGTPVPDIIVTLASRSNKRQVQGLTDHRGRYRFYGLPADDYFVSARPSQSLQKLMYPASVAADRDVDALLKLLASRLPQGTTVETSIPVPGSQPLLGFVPVFYPGSADPTFAEPIELSEEQERYGVDIQLLVSGTARVSGTVVTSLGELEASAWITASVGGTSSYSSSVRASDGRFEIANLPPGRYTVRARATLRTAAGDPAVLTASQVVDVSGDVDGLVLTLQKGVDLAGHLSFGNAPIRSPNVLVKLQQLPSHGQMVFQRTVGTDGAFAFNGLEPGSYSLTAVAIGPSAAGWFLVSVQLNGEESIGRPIGMRPSSTSNATLVFSREPASLDGVVRGLNSGATYSVVAFAKDPSLIDPALGRVVRTTVRSDGSYRFDNLAPGDYLLGIHSGTAELSAMGILAELSRSAVAVTIKPGLRTVQDLQAQR